MTHICQFSGFHDFERQLLCLCLLELLLQGDIPKVAKQAGREVRTQTIHFFEKQVRLGEGN